MKKIPSDNPNKYDVGFNTTSDNDGRKYKVIQNKSGTISCGKG